MAKSVLPPVMNVYQSAKPMEVRQPIGLPARGIPSALAACPSSSGEVPQVCGPSDDQHCVPVAVEPESFAHGRLVGVLDVL